MNFRLQLLLLVISTFGLNAAESSTSGRSAQEPYYYKIYNIFPSVYGPFGEKINKNRSEKGCIYLYDKHLRYVSQIRLNTLADFTQQDIATIFAKKGLSHLQVYPYYKDYAGPEKSPEDMEFLVAAAKDRMGRSSKQQNINQNKKIIE